MTSRRAALVVSTPINRCDLALLPRLAELVGPVKARTFRQASRLSNRLRAGFPVHTNEELDPSRVILICASRETVGDVVNGLSSAPLNWQRRVVLVCGRGCDRSVLGRLAERGAATGSLAPVERAGGLRYFLGGDTTALRAGRRFIEHAGGTVTEIAPDTQLLGAAAASLSSWVLLPAIDGSMQCLRQAGLTPGRAKPIIEQAVARTLRAYLKGGRRSWKAPQSAGGRAEFLDQVERVREADPKLADAVVGAARLSLRWVGESADWLPESRRTTSRVAAAPS